MEAMPMPYWIVVTDGGSEEVNPPIGTRRVLGREQLGGGRVKWLVEGEEYMLALPEVLLEVLSVEEVPVP